MTRTHSPAIFLLLAFVFLPLANAQDASHRLRGKLLAELLDRAVARAQGKVEKEANFVVDRSEWENAWEVKSAHYVVSTTQSYAYALEVAQGLETMLGHMRQLLQSKFEPAERFPVYILPDMAAYRKFGNDHGETHSSIHGAFYARNHPKKPVATYYDKNRLLVNMQITHAALHQFVEQAFGKAPDTWIDEGLASYFATFWANDWVVGELKRIQEQGMYRPLVRLQRASISQYGTATAQASFIELGMLFTYLLSCREDTKTIYDGKSEARAPFAAYLRRSVRGRSVRDLPIHQLLTKGLRDLETDFRAYDFPIKGK